MKNERTWVVTFDSNTCRLYDYDKKHLQLIKEVTHPENKQKDSELIADRQGRYQAQGAHGTYSQASDPHALKIDNFAREIAKDLEHERSLNSFEKLILIAPSHMKGLLFKHLNTHVQDMIKSTLDKNLMHVPAAELLNHLHREK